MQESRSKPTNRFRQNEQAVSEVIGQILTLGIMSTLLIAALWGFAVAKDNTTERAVSVQGDSLLQEIAGTAVQAALFAEKHSGTQNLQFTSRIDLPTELEGHPYFVDLDSDEVIIEFPRFQGNVSAPLFQAGAGTAVTVCDQAPIPGGPLTLNLREEGSLDPTHACYVASSTTLVLYLEIA